MAAGASIGKRVRGSFYLHKDAVDLLDIERRRSVERSVGIAGDRSWNVVRIDRSSVALLDYDEFDDAPFPRLLTSTLVKARSERPACRSYHESGNPLILHRKELLVRPEHPRRAEWAELTARLVAKGLFAEPARIGRERQWQTLLAEAGVSITALTP